MPNAGRESGDGEPSARHARPPAAPSPAVRRARAYLDAHPDARISLAVLARVAGLSPCYLARVFHDEVGVPPHLYLERARVRHAEALLRGGLSLAQVALEAGFVDQSHFTKRFKAHLGVTPGAYRRHARDRKRIPNGPRRPV